MAVNTQTADSSSEARPLEGTPGQAAALSGGSSPEQAGPLAEAGTEYTIGSLRPEIREIVANSSGPTQAFIALLNLLQAESAIIASSTRIRFGASSISEFLLDSNSIAPGKETVFKSSHQQLLQQVQSNDEAIVRTQTINNGKSLLATLAIPIPFASLEAGRGAIVVSLCAASEEVVQSLLCDYSDAICFAAAIIGHNESIGDMPKVERDLQAMSRTVDFRSARHMAFALANNLADRFGCEQTGLGLVIGNRIEVAAVSGTATFKANSPGIADMRQAMEECFDDGHTIVSQNGHPIPEYHQRPIHRQWSQNTRSAVCSVPLEVGGGIVAVVSLRRPVGEQFLVDEIQQISEAVAPFACPIDLYRKSERTLRKHCAQNLSQLGRAALKPSTKLGLMMRVVGLATVVFLLFGWLPYQPKCVARIVPANMTHMQAAFDMRLSEVRAVSGQTVKKGQVLAVFDTHELELEGHQMEAERARYEAEMRNFSNLGDTANAAIAKAKSLVFKAKLRGIENRMEKCVMTAPYDGVILEGNLNRSLGQIFAQGTPVLSIAPLNECEVELSYPESVVPYVLAAKSGSFASLAQPNKSVAFELLSIDGTATVEEGKNILHARARLLSKHDGLRPGLDGIAYTDAGWKPVLWITFHGLYDYARYHFWI